MHEDGKNMSPQKKYKLKPNPITPQATFWSVRQVLNEVCFKYYSFRYSKGQICASVFPQLGISSALSLSNFKPFFKNVRTVAIQKRNGISVKT